MSDEWRVELTIGEEADRASISERLLAAELGEDASEALGGRTIVTHDGPHVFLYSRTRDGALTAEHVAREIAEQNGIDTATVVTRWHPDEQAWKNADVPLPETDEERAAERAALERAEARELEEQGTFDWEVRIEMPGHAATVEFAGELVAEGFSVTRRWRYLLVGALTESDAEELADELRARVPSEARVRVDANLDEFSHPLFVFLRSHV